jgi:hypothetical protein
MARIENYGSNVRVRYEGNPMDNAYDVFVDQLGDDGVWVFAVLRYNSMSDDYAYTNAKQAAKGLQSRLMGVTK